MSLVFAGVCSHAPGITGRAHLADPGQADAFHAAFHGLGELLAARPDAVIVVGAEHFANFFMNNMPAFAIGMADEYEGPIEDPPGSASSGPACRGTRRCRSGSSAA